MELPFPVRNVLGGFPDDLDEPSERKGQLQVAVEVFARAAVDEGDRLPGRIEHVLQPNAIVTLRHIDPGPRGRPVPGSTC